MVVSLVGKFTYEKQENLLKFYKSLNVPEAFVDKLMPPVGSIKEFTIDGNKITMTGSYSATFILGQEVDETNEYNYTFKSTSNMEGSTLVVVSKTPEKHNTTLKRFYEPTIEGLTITMTCEEKTPVVAKYFYKRV